MQPDKPTAPVPSDYSTGQPVAQWRTYLAICLALTGGILAGYTLSYADFGFIPMWLFLIVVAPIAVCVLTASHHLFVATMPVGAMMIFLLVRVYFPGDGAFAWRLRPDEKHTLFIVTLVMTVISLLVASVIGTVFGRFNSESQRRVKR